MSGARMTRFFEAAYYFRHFGVEIGERERAEELLHALFSHSLALLRATVNRILDESTPQHRRKLDGAVAEAST